MPVEGRALTSGCTRRDRDQVIGREPIHTGLGRTFPSALYCGAKAISVCFIVKPVGEPDAGNPYVRFDERGWETGRQHRQHPRPSSTLRAPQRRRLLVGGSPTQIVVGKSGS